MTEREEVNEFIYYLGDISNPEKTKYSLAYYLNLADELITNGAHVLCIKVIILFYIFII